MEALLAFYSELVAENANTQELRRAVEARDEKEKSDIAAAKQTIISWWEKHRPGHPLPDEITRAQPPVATGATPQGACVDPSERVKQSLAAAFDQMPVRFTTKDLFPLVPEIHAEEVPDSQGYDFLRRQIEEKKLWIYQQGAGRRATTYSKEPVNDFRREVNEVIARGNGVDTSVVMIGNPVTHTISVPGGHA